MSAPKPAYGGQAVIEGVLIRGKRTLALACRRPDGGIYRYRETIDSPLQRSRFARLPFVRGVIVLWESLVHGGRMLMRSADVQAEGLGEAKPSALSTAATLAASIAFALVVFVGIPYGSTQLLRDHASTPVLNLIEGVVQFLLMVLYIWAISFMPEIRRVFAYHGAEHMTIHAFEHGDPLDAEHVVRYPTAHPRCGTAFLLLVASIGVFTAIFMPRILILVDLAARLATVFVVAAVSYEVLRLGAAHERNPVMRAVVWPGMLLQRITTRQPDAGMIEVAIASLEEALAGDAETGTVAA
ncbi:MAG: DUF1385 domain-containing protein [Chloroflexi bacterium]|nr:DUF1385 domain-containing protein [Chloroflexota bacterium]